MKISLKIQATVIFILWVITSSFENILSLTALLLVVNYIYSFGILVVGAIEFYKKKDILYIPWFEVLLFLISNLIIFDKYSGSLFFFLAGVIICLLILIFGSFLVKTIIEKIMKCMGRTNLTISMLILATVSFSFFINPEKQKSVAGVVTTVEWSNIDSIDSRPATIFKINSVRKKRLSFLPIVSKNIWYYFHYNGIRFNGTTNTEILDLKLNDEFYAEFPIGHPEKSVLNFQKPFDIISIINEADTTKNVPKKEDTEKRY